ncbi:MAG: tRNA lysidine(34) synthetase TilS, partial [Acidobacteria bacterium]|nr:tRNA lysidine(34) synthetase TilS [Acidobacteriota bacterium]
LAAIRPVTAQGLVRPLIDIPRAAVLDYLRRRGLPWREDSTNASPRFTRNRIRHQLLQALARDYNPALEETLAHTADWAFEEEAYWEAEIDRLAGQHLRDGILPAGLIAQLPRAAARRLIRRAIQSAKGDLRGVAFSHIEQVLEMAAASDGRGRMQGPGLEVRRSFDRLRFGAPSESRSWRVPLTVPGHFALPGEGATLHLELKESSEGAICVYNGVGSCLDWERIGGPLELRSWRPGDRYHPVGQTHVERIKVLFQEARVPLWERRNWPVITCGEEILWTRRFGPAARFAARPGSRKLLTVRETSGSADE